MKVDGRVAQYMDVSLSMEKNMYTENYLRNAGYTVHMRWAELVNF